MKVARKGSGTVSRAHEKGSGTFSRAKRSLTPFRVAFGEGWILLAGMAVAAAALVGLFVLSSARPVRLALGVALTLLLVRFAIAPAAAAFTRALRRKRRTS